MTRYSSLGSEWSQESIHILESGHIPRFFDFIAVVWCPDRFADEESAIITSHQRQINE